MKVQEAILQSLREFSKDNLEKITMTCICGRGSQPELHEIIDEEQASSLIRRLHQRAKDLVEGKNN
jgi:precorrin-6x reductase